MSQSTDFEKWGNKHGRSNQQIHSGGQGCRDSQGLQEGSVTTEEVKNDAEIRLIGFGTFKKAKRAARKGRNPQTGAEIEIAASESLSFKSSVKY